MTKNKLFRCVTAGLGDYWVVARHASQAIEQLEKTLSDGNYGFSGQRVVSEVEILANQIEIRRDGKPQLSGYKLLIVEEELK